MTLDPQHYEEPTVSTEAQAAAKNEPYTPPAMINDGFTLTAKIAAVPNLHPEVTFSYRPVSWVDQARITQTVPKDAEEAMTHRAREVAKRLVSWSLAGTPTPELLMRLQPGIFFRMESIVLGMGGADEVYQDRKN